MRNQQKEQYILENEYLRICVAAYGGELQSIYGKKEKCEYLWQGNPAYWEERSPNLFPYIARLTNGQYRYKGQLYEMKIHGLVKYRQLQCRKMDNELICELDADQETIKSYPFLFKYRIRYRLEHTKLHITYEVMNKGDTCMYFGVGGHPGFQIPYERETNFEDYRIILKKKAGLSRVVMSDDCFVIGETECEEAAQYGIELHHTMFDQDAMIFHTGGNCARIECMNEKNKKVVEIDFPDMRYLGIWHMPHTNAPYVCVEPWTSLPSRKGIIEDLETQENLVALHPGNIYKNNWSIQIR